MRYKAFAINLKSNAYRRDHILAQQRMAGIDIHIFEAVTPATADQAGIDLDTGGARWFTGRAMMETEIACALSHMSLWKQLLDDTGADYYLIMEDDIEIEDNIASIIASVDMTDIDFLKLSGQCKRPMKLVNKLDEKYNLVRYAYGPLDAACYMVSKRAAKALLSYCRDLKAPVDILMDRSYDHGIAVYGVMPYPTKTSFCFDEANPLRSDVGVRNDDYKKDRTAIMNICVRLHRVAGGLKKKIAIARLKFNV